MAKITKDQFVEALKEMSLLEIKELLDGLKETFGIDPSAVAAAPSQSQDQGGASEKTEFDVILVSPGSAKLGVVKVVKEICSNLGLKEAKDLVDAAPKAIKEKISKAEADEIAKKLTDAGAEVKIQ